MAGSSFQKQKLLHVADILQKRTDEQHPMTADEIVSELENRGISAERKSVYSDIQELCDFGFDILKTRSGKSGFYLVSRDWEPVEIRLLCDAVLSAEFITGNKSRELVDNLCKMLSKSQGEEIKSQLFIENRKKEKNEEIYYNIDKIQRAIACCKKIHCTYRRRRAEDGGKIVTESKEFTVSPYALLWEDDRYYLIGNNEKYDNLMHLRLDRIKSAEILSEPARSFEEVSEYKNTFDVADYARKISNAFGGKTETVELKCKNEMLEQMFDRFGDDIRIRPLSDGSFTFKIRVAQSAGLTADIVGFGDSVEVLRPEELRKSVREAAKKICRIYDKEE